MGDPAAQKLLICPPVSASLWVVLFDSTKFDRKKPPPPGGFPTYYVPSSRTRRKRNPLVEFVPSASRGVLFLQVLDQGT